MRKVINPVVCFVSTRTGKKQKVNGFCEINYSDGRLSISGVVGPLPSGNCRGSAGQCVEEIRNGTPASGWNREMLNKFCDIWDRWHLNDMRAYCSHQKELGWDKEASEEITVYHYSLTSEALKKQKEAEKEAISSLKNGGTFTPNDEQVFYANLKYFVDSYGPLSGDFEKYYKPYNGTFIGSSREQKKRGWVRFDECDKGILCKPCPVCGYKYGTSWLKEEVPQDVVDWLFSLPETSVRPAWV